MELDGKLARDEKQIKVNPVVASGGFGFRPLKAGYQDDIG